MKEKYKEGVLSSAQASVLTPLHINRYKINFSAITGRNEVVAKVMFLQVSVCPHGGGSVSVHAGMPSPPIRQTPPDQADPPGTRQTPPGTRQTPPDQADPPRIRPPRDQVDTPRTRQTPPGSRLQHTVYERPVRILLECIFV